MIVERTIVTSPWQSPSHVSQSKPCISHGPQPASGRPIFVVHRHFRWFDTINQFDDNGTNPNQLMAQRPLSS